MRLESAPLVSHMCWPTSGVLSYLHQESKNGIDKQTILQYNIVNNYLVKQYSGGDSLIPSQMLKGTLEGCVLAILRSEERYGYEISQRLEGYGFGRIPEGTIYPLLLRLEKRGSITASFRASPEGPQRKYYALTDLGQKELIDFLHHYRELTKAVDELIQMTGGDPHACEDKAASRGE